MSLPCDLYLLINDYLHPSTRRALAQVSPTFDTVHQKWCTGKAQSLLQRCPFLGYLGLTRLTTMLRSPVTITFDATTLQSTTCIDNFLTSCDCDAIVGDEYDRVQVEVVLKHLIHRRAVQRIPQCHPLFIMDYGDKLIVLDDNLNLYLDGQRVLSGITDISFHSDYLERTVLTEQGEVYDFEGETESEIRQICQTGFVTHHSGLYHVHDDYYLSDDEEFDVKVSNSPIVLLCHGDSTCLLTCVDANASRTSFIVGIYDNEVIFRSFIPPVRMAVDIKLGYLVLLDDGSCAILRRDIFDDQTRTDVIIQDATYDHIGRCEYNIIVGRRGDDMYHLDIQDDRVIEQETDGFFVVQTQNGAFELKY